MDDNDGGDDDDMRLIMMMATEVFSSFNVAVYSRKLFIGQRKIIWSSYFVDYKEHLQMLININARHSHVNSLVWQPNNNKTFCG